MITAKSDDKREPEYVTAWETTTPEEPKEQIPFYLLAGFQALQELMGPITLRRIDPLPVAIAKRERTFYQLHYRDNLSFRMDGTYSGPFSICFYGPGGRGDTLDHCIINAISEIEYFRGCTLVNPPIGVYGPVKALKSLSLRGEMRPEIDRSEDLELAMKHVLGRVPMDWPLHRRLEPMEGV